jgi:branched-chain amino acid transport system substrate-binding protein
MELAGNSAEGLIVSTTVPTFLRDKNIKTENFNNSYFDKYNIKPSLEHIYAARAYDAFILIAKGLENCPSSSTECLKDYLYNIKNFSGVSGDISFDRNGDVSSRFELEIIKDGKFMEYDKGKY